jgi:hypothetical protein
MPVGPHPGDEAGETDRDTRGEGRQTDHTGAHSTTTTRDGEEQAKRTQAWRDEPPYRTAPTNRHHDKKHTAQCHCGRVKYWLSRERPLASKYCHCTDCQALHGESLQDGLLRSFLGEALLYL